MYPGELLWSHEKVIPFYYAGLLQSGILGPCAFSSFNTLMAQ